MTILNANTFIDNNPSYLRKLERNAIDKNNNRELIFSLHIVQSRKNPKKKTQNNMTRSDFACQIRNSFLVVNVIQFSYRDFINLLFI